MSTKPKVCIIGSINMDMVTTVDTIPAQGETVLGGTFTTNPGGKGANQAVAAARLGAAVSFIGAVGDDALGKTLLHHFDNENINRLGVRTLPHVSTGIATIIVSQNDNRIIVASGANAKVTPELIKENEERIINSDMILMQFEIPMETIEYTVNLGFQHNIPIILNPAPYQDISPNLLAKATYFTPNEVEAAAMGKNDSINERMIITKGKLGVEFYSTDDGWTSMPAYQVPVKDTTGAGDTFNGAFAAELARGSNLNEAVTFANAAAALSISKIGAQTGMPKKEEVDKFLKRTITQPMKGPDE